MQSMQSENYINSKNKEKPPGSKKAETTGQYQKKSQVNASIDQKNEALYCSILSPQKKGLLPLFYPQTKAIILFVICLETLNFAMDYFQARKFCFSMLS